MTKRKLPAALSASLTIVAWLVLAYLAKALLAEHFVFFSIVLFVLSTLSFLFFEHVFTSIIRLFCERCYLDDSIMDRADDLHSLGLDVEKISTHITKFLSQLIGSDIAAILTYNGPTSGYLVEYSRGFDIDFLEKFFSDHSQKFLSIRIDDSAILTLDAWKKPETRFMSELNQHGVGLVSLVRADDEISGFILLGRPQAGSISRDDARTISVYCSQAAFILRNALSFAEKHSLASEEQDKIDELSAELSATNLKQEKIEQSKSDFISITSHQLRTPLTIVKGFTSMLLEGSFGPLPEKQIAPLKTVYQANDRLIQLIENLLNISRIDAGRMQFKYEVGNLEELVAEVIEDFGLQAHAKGIEIKWNGPTSNLPTVSMDKEKIRQVIFNLFENAVKFSEKGSVKITLEKSGNYVAFAIADTGQGIEPQRLGTLFQKYSKKNEPSMLQEGVGLGLYVSRQIIEAHKGEIFAESAGEGKGSVFTFKLPIQ